jgi:molybdenum cofactor sulfurtransferase
MSRIRTDVRGSYAVDDDFRRVEEDFLRRYPDYRATIALDDLRRTDYGRLDNLGHTYLDYMGGGLYAESQLRDHHNLLSEHVLGNPHSSNPTSAASFELVTEARDAVLRHFNAVDEDYEVIFCANASAALKLVGEAYPFRPGGAYLLSYDNHNSVNGIREFARRKGAAVSYVPVRRPHLRLDEDLLRRALSEVGSGPDRLFAYPAQSNLSGVQHPLGWVAKAQALGWDVLLDCAAYVPTNRLDLGAVKPDYVVLSFYKMFGYPTGLGALIARHEKLAKLRRPWFAGGTIAAVSVQGESWRHRLATGAAGFEDGTVDYLGVPAVTIGLRHLELIGIETIHTRTYALTAWLLEELQRMRHDNGVPVVRIFGPPDMDRHGAMIALHLLDPSGRPHDVYGVEAAAGRQHIAIRTGCLCNPGAGVVAHDITEQDMQRCFSDTQAAMSERECQKAIEDSTGKVPGTIRVSLGVASDFGDVRRFLWFTAAYRNRETGWQPSEAVDHG